MATIVEREQTEEAAPEPTEAELAVEAEIELTEPQQHWLEDLELRVKEWQHNRSEQPFAAQGGIGKLDLEDFTPEDINLFHVYRQLQKLPHSLYFQQKFGRLLRQRLRDTQGDTHSTSYQLTKVLKAFDAAA